MRLHWTSAALGAVIAGGLGCSPDLSMYPPIEGCSLDAGRCGGPSGGGTGPGTGVGGAGGNVTTSTGSGGVAVGELRGDVEPFTSTTFTMISGTPMAGAATIVFTPASGPPINVGYGGANGTSFDVMKVPGGEGWGYVQDACNGADGIWPTITQFSVPQLSNIAIPVVTQQLFANLASDLPTVQLTGVSPQAAQIVLLLTLAEPCRSQALQVTGGSGAATGVYDIGPGTYSDSATMTGSGGTIILFNSGGSGMTTITVTSMQLTKSYPLPVYITAGAVTVAGYDLPSQ